MLRSLRNFVHLNRIAFILARYDALFSLEACGISSLLLLPLRFIPSKHQNLSPGNRLALAVEQLGPSFIKLGQTLSTRADIIGEALARDLADLRDNLAPFPSEIAQKILEEDLGTLENIFLQVDEPIAAASIAQVHHAVTLEGKHLAIKILRPGIEKAFARDLDLFFWLAEIIEKRLPKYRRLKPIEIVKTLEESVSFELDMRFEGAAAQELRDNTTHDVGFYVPEIDWRYTTRRVLAMEWVDGIRIHDVDALKNAHHDLTKILSNASMAFFNQVFRDGFFHADLHPGNLFVDKDSNIVVVDFGIMGRVDEENRLYLAEILRGFLQQDYTHVAQVHIDAGYVPANQSVERFAQACMAIGKPIMGRPLNEISVGKLLGQLFAITETFQMETQPQLLLLQKTMVLAEGIGRMLNPSVNMWQTSEPLVESWIRDHFGVKAKASQLAGQGMDILRTLPKAIKDGHAMITETRMHGLKLHPATLAQFRGPAARRAGPWRFIAWVSIFALAVSLYLR